MMLKVKLYFELILCANVLTKLGKNFLKSTTFTPQKTSHFWGNKIKNTEKRRKPQKWGIITFFYILPLSIIII